MDSAYIGENAVFINKTAVVYIIIFVHNKKQLIMTRSKYWRAFVVIIGKDASHQSEKCAR